MAIIKIITKSALEEILSTEGYLHLEHKTLLNRDGTRLRARSNGRIKTWKRDPAAFKLPMKHGLRDYFYLTHENKDEWEIV